MEKKQNGGRSRWISVSKVWISVVFPSKGSNTGVKIPFSKLKLYRSGNGREWIEGNKLECENDQTDGNTTLIIDRNVTSYSFVG
jgi:hypothetical protein